MAEEGRISKYSEDSFHHPQKLGAEQTNRAGGAAILCRQLTSSLVLASWEPPGDKES